MYAIIGGGAFIVVVALAIAIGCCVAKSSNSTPSRAVDNPYSYNHRNHNAPIQSSSRSQSRFGKKTNDRQFEEDQLYLKSRAQERYASVPYVPPPEYRTREEYEMSNMPSVPPPPPPMRQDTYLAPDTLQRSNSSDDETYYSSIG